MEYNIKVKPTYYKGLHFRSKLEAQWAAFFDLVGIDWEYEPERFENWEPDFLLHGVSPIYTEVKPYINKDTIKKYELKCLDVIKSNHKVIIISSATGSNNNNIQEGFQENPFGIEYIFNGEYVDHCSLYWKDSFDFSSKMYFWDGMIGSCSTFKSFISSDDEELKENWFKAKNIIQTQIK